MKKDERRLFTDSKITSQYFEVGDKVSIKVYFFTPKTPTINHTLIFVPGWTSTMYSWRYFLPKLSKNVNVIYIETREKSSSKTNKNSSFTVKDMANDIRIIIKSLKLKDNTYSISGSSLGASSILEALSKFDLNPNSLTLILPNQSFKIPKSIYLFKYIPNSFFSFIKPFIKWYMINFKINKNDLNHQTSFLRSINNIENEKVKRSAISLRKYKMNNRVIKEIQIKTLVIGASKDKLHSHQEVINISKILPNCEFIDLITFSHSHSSKAVDNILLFLQNVILDNNE